MLFETCADESLDATRMSLRIRHDAPSLLRPFLRSHTRNEICLMEMHASIYDYMLIRNIKSTKELRLIQSFEFSFRSHRLTTCHDTNFFDLAIDSIRRNESCSLRKHPMLHWTDDYELFEKSLFRAGLWERV